MRTPFRSRVRTPFRTPFRTRRIRLLFGSLCLVLLPVVVATSGPAGLGPQAAYAAGGEGSEVTVSGTGDFADLKVTVGQTRNLVGQVVKISWTGGKPTVSDTAYSANYLQIMQCWGDEATGPAVDQCQFGASSALGSAGNQAGAYTNTRQLNYGANLQDAEHEPLPPPTPSGISFAPFRTVGGDPVSPGNWNEFYDVNSTNEVPYARTNARGAGEVWFETQTAVEAPGLGCGSAIPGAQVPATGRGCWLVIVPRGEKEVDGSPYTAQSSGQLQSSPLSPANWKQRIVVPLGFEPLGSYCPIGAEERGTIGSEMAAEAVTRWQPALCRTGGKAIYGYAQVPDETARVKLLSGAPGLVFLGRPAAADPVRKPVYAPVALSGITIGFFIESQAGFQAPDEVKARNGTRLGSLRLTPRLVAKLLTESYQDGNSRFAESTAKNPANLGRDPEFMRHNPTYAGLDFGGKLGDALVPQPLADTTRQLWEWVSRDPAAREFLDGTPDNTGAHGDAAYAGMAVNPNYRGLVLPVDTFPKSDPYCQPFPEEHPNNPLCIQDKHPYATDMHAAARAASRGDTLARTSWDATATPPAYKKDPPQLAGSRAVLAVTDTATADRYGLVRAELLNAAGTFVAPEPAALIAAANARKAGTDGVSSPDPAAADPAAYPLTVLTYAATVPADLTQAEGKDYGALLAYAAAQGQTPGVSAGSLPHGYAPLPEALRAQTRAAAQRVSAEAGKKPTPAPEPSAPTAPAPGAVGGTPSGTGGAAVPGGSGSAGTGTSASGASTAGGGGAAGGAAAPGPAAASPSTPAGTTGAAGATGTTGTSGAPAAQAAGTTPDWVVGAIRNVLLICLVVGALAAFAGPVLPRYLPGALLRLRSLRGAAGGAPVASGGPADLPADWATHKKTGPRDWSPPDQDDEGR
ncbi:hypothetical protein [Streptomyces sp. G1]|uniref:hypothetical protein n=1 Tax=Streptomyces sp. G1 TaxID=361572 RepID=UPI00202DF71F|nr:hypothetical protein [Streptomyces sp. G1]MCM1966708.1 hypothetical protein [Streptomyces sp. G1]